MILWPDMEKTMSRINSFDNRLDALEAEGEAILEAHHNTVKRLARPPDIRDSLPGWPEGAHGPVEAI